MTKTLPAKIEGQQLAPREYNTLKDQARSIAKSGLAPRGVDTPEKVLVIALKGRELGIPPMQALSHIHIVEGKPTISSELMVALVQRAGHKLRVLKTTASECVVQGVRRDDPEYPQELAFTMADAEAAGVAKKQNWRNYPAAMLRARAISALCRYAFADVLMGASYTPEELGAEVDEEGQVLEAEEPAKPGGAAPGEAPEYATAAQVTLLSALADDLFEEKAVELEGHEWLQEQLGHPLEDLTKARADKLIETYRRKWDELNPPEANAEANAEEEASKAELVEQGG